jgi:hypothetical protein
MGLETDTRKPITRFSPVGLLISPIVKPAKRSELLNRLTMRSTRVRLAYSGFAGHQQVQSDHCVVPPSHLDNLVEE